MENRKSGKCDKCGFEGEFFDRGIGCPICRTVRMKAKWKEKQGLKLKIVPITLLTVPDILKKTSTKRYIIPKLPWQDDKVCERLKYALEHKRVRDGEAFLIVKGTDGPIIKVIGLGTPVLLEEVILAARKDENGIWKIRTADRIDTLGLNIFNRSKNKCLQMQSQHTQ